jgi:prepilin-type processing-associated H-X9-DG protein
MQGLSTAMIVYMNNYDDHSPTQDQWCDLLIQEADVSPKSFQCPLDPEGSFSYAINENLYKLEPSEVSPQMVMLFEADLGRNGVGGPEDLVIRHDELNNHGYNVVFADGHVDFITEDRIGELQWTVE